MNAWMNRLWLLILLLLLSAAPALSDVLVEVKAPGGRATRATQSLPDASGAFDLNLPLIRNSVNYNVSVFSVVLTIAQESIPISVPIVLPKSGPEMGYETVKIKSGRGSGSGGTPRIRDAEVLVFERPVSVPGQGIIRLPGVIVIDGRIKSLKELFSVRLLLMNTSGIFTLSDVTAEIQLPEGALTAMVPDSGVVAYGDILPGSSDAPGQQEREFIVRGDSIGIHDIAVDFGGVLTGPGIPEDEPIPFNGSALTELEVKGPPTLDIELRHPDEVVAGELYDFEVLIRNTDDIPALYATLQLDMGFDAELVSCTGSGLDDFTPPELTLSVLPPVDPNLVLPGQLVQVNAYAGDQGSGIARVEARIRDLADPNGALRLVDQRTTSTGAEPPFIFAIDSSTLEPGRDYELRVTAIDRAGNGQDATLSLIIATSAAAPTLVLPDEPTQPVPAGTFLDLTPVQVSAGVRTLRFCLDGAADPFKTVNLPPFTTSLATAKLGQGAHQVRAEAEDGLGQIGTALFDFTLGAGDVAPVVLFPGVADGSRFVQGETLQVVPQASHDTGIAAIEIWLDDPADPQPWQLLGDSVLVDTTTLAPGQHRLVVLATSNAGNANDPASPSAYLAFEVVAANAGDPPPAPVLTGIGAPVDGRALVSGSTVAQARVRIENLDTGLVINADADSEGAFSAAIDALPGARIAVLAYDLDQSPNPSAAVEASVPAPATLLALNAAPASLSFTAVGGFSDLGVMGQYDDGASADLTGAASFRSAAPGVATVSAAGRVAAVASGNAEIVVTAGGVETRVPVTVSTSTMGGQTLPMSSSTSVATAMAPLVATPVRTGSAPVSSNRQAAARAPLPSMPRAWAATAATSSPPSAWTRLATASRCPLAPTASRPATSLRS